MSQALNPYASKFTGPVAQKETIEAEQTLLGTILLTPGCLDSILRDTEAGMFVEPLHQRIWAVIEERAALGERISVTNIVARLGNDEIKGLGVTIKDYLVTLRGAYAEPGSHAGQLARAVADAAGMRQLESMSEQLSEDLRSGGILDPLPVAQGLVRQADEIIGARLSNHARPCTIAAASRRALEKALKAQAGEKVLRVPYGIPSLDRMTRGIEPGQLIVIGGRPAMGKTGLVLEMVDRIAAGGVPAMMSSLEMTADDIAERMLSSRLYRQGVVLPYSDLSAGNFDASLADALIAAQAEIDTLPLKIDPRPNVTLAEVASEARRYFSTALRDGEPGVLAIDYLGLMRASDRYRANRNLELGEIANGLKALAKELGIGILLLAQLNRRVEERTDKHPVLSDLRDSGEIEQAADTVLFVYRDEYYTTQRLMDEDLDHDERADLNERLHRLHNVLEIGIAKQRKGETGWIHLFSDIRCNYVSELRI